MTQETGAAPNNARRIKGDSPAGASPTTCSQLASATTTDFFAGLSHRAVTSGDKSHPVSCTASSDRTFSQQRSNE